MNDRGFRRVGGDWTLAYLKFRHRRIIQWLVPIFAKAHRDHCDAGAWELAQKKLAGEIDARMPRRTT